MNELQIDKYWTKVNLSDKAGGDATQREGAEIIDRVEGSYTNVVGLPMEETVAALAEFGIQPGTA